MQPEPLSDSMRVWCSHLGSGAFPPEFKDVGYGSPGIGFGEFKLQGLDEGWGLGFSWYKLQGFSGRNS